ncbi:endoglucanase [Mesorhizobium sp. M3A.F.Ca.ET.174.01.1.1]|nr:endoglucanase [Mesorhizobium sp. M3A.F.Ca.ET.080.04.2.1]PBB83862.1 endoglucanase [Mesorhizobium sp. WSM3876]RWB67812.1 MAG: endoglucanase [Mesorhizobium sp.]TGS61279.1 endoglucanase [Mesorhizobium sp. M3A.F.Ca.ET.201.01.1.1]TGS89689.1 endoglucanase [Mesorhizobium sp. M3A.F.Ca.ET.175.01.1.1]TGT31462.1 endoglucanase [Mesorhizobium sp. M3A.F.Ca.ET.174.01.1.1]TGT53644.1 endoglucanase [Mesorhizobium sp. M00.F.Ca.ET.170.01.1.1]
MQAFLVAFALAASLLAPARASLAAAAITSQEWSLYKDKFLDPAGRIVDNANGGISHSEGQGYGLLLSYLAGNRGDFDRIWAFTRTEMMVRDDGLAAWKWDPAAKPHISDTNNASDGDLLIAYGLALAGEAWHRPDLTQAATGMAMALAAGSLEKVGDLVLLKPGNSGFAAGDRPDGPVVNPSYWVFEALPVMAELAPDGPWNELAANGRTLLASSMKIGPSELPPDWVSLKAQPAVADGFPQEFSYNALRIPLYLLRAGIHDRDLLAPFLSQMPDDQGRVRIVDIATGQTRQLLADSGYRIIPALVSCVIESKPLAGDLKAFQPTDYYPSTLQLLALAYARRHHPECL